jgi:hypothetical protein
MKCKKCENDTVTNHPFCFTCEGQFLLLGLCKWCGANRRKIKKVRHLKQSDYCDGCQNGLLMSKEIKPEYHGRYRGPDARENVRETKGHND